MLQEVAAPECDLMLAAGFQILLRQNPDHAASAQPRVLMGVEREDARAAPGSTLSFLFLSPPSRLNLRASVQRMLGLALQQRTDEDIATALGCSRDYVRKLWGDAYLTLEQAGVLAMPDRSAGGLAARPRGRERRRRALEFLRDNPQELRPGLPL